MRSIGAVLFAWVIVTALSTGTDQVFHALKVYPPWGQPMFEPALNLLALCYRIPIQVLGSYLTARWAPYSPMRHVWIGAIIGIALTAIGGIAAVSKGMGPSWFPIVLALSVVPTAWLGGTLWVRTQRRQRRP